jgi:bifunctional non-homologous end joining protein LigD
MSETPDKLQFGPHVVELSNSDKLFFPDAGITKGEVVEYYRRVAEVALPHIQGRPLTLQRFPDGIGEEGFFQQARSGHFPDYVGKVRAERVDGSEIDHVVVENTAALVYLADQAVIAFHTWLARQDRLHHPDRLIFDLDPPDGGFDAVRQGAHRVGELLRELGFTPYVMTTGSRGLHVLAPLDRSARFDAVRDFAQDAAALLARRYPDALTTEQRKDKREGRLYLDVMRNAYGQTAVMPYSLRAKPGAPAATPLDWDELGDGDLDAQTYNLRNLFRRLGQKDDPWADMRRHGKGIGPAREALAELMEEEGG